MFVLPPPPRHPNGNPYATLPGGVSLLETNNILEHPRGAQYQLVVGEGTYTLHDDLLLATPPPHPSDLPHSNSNPLAPASKVFTASTKLSVISLGNKRALAHTQFPPNSSRSQLSLSIQEESSNSKSEAGSAGGYGTGHDGGRAGGFGDGNPALQPLPVKGKKDQRAKPKNSLVKSNSSYVSRHIPHDALNKRLNERGTDDIFAFANINRGFLWLDLSSEKKVENLTKVLFTKAHVLAHDVNSYNKSANHLDVVMGFNSSDIIWYEPMSQRYARLNKNGAINPTPILKIKWLPNKEGLFIAAHQDGTLVVYDKEKEDADFVAESLPGGATQYVAGGPYPRFEVYKSVESRNQKTNPVACWKVSNLQVTDLAFSPDGRLLAVVGDDGCLTIIDYIKERVLDVYRSYYGGLLCVTWSPDGRYVLTGGQDDLVSVWSVSDKALVARCFGHQSWVTDVKFDPWRCDERNYRFGSVGEDCRLLLWDFSVSMLARPKQSTAQRTGSISGHARKQSTATSRVRSSSNVSHARFEGDADDGESDVIHDVDPRASIAMLPPVMSKAADPHPLAWVGFEEHCIITSCKDGHIREWHRPTSDTIDVADSDQTSS